MSIAGIFVLGFMVGCIIAGLACFLYFWEKYSDRGGNILIDDKTGVYRIVLNDDIEDWGDEKYVILKVSKSEQRLKRLNDIDPMDLEEK